MTKRQTRLFFVIGTLLFAVIFIVLTINSHAQFDKLTNAQNITPAVVAGKEVWHAKNCINCHTLLGEGAYYAPDLTKITTQRGEPYLREFLKDPSKFYSEATVRRIMPNMNMTDEEITNVIAFLDWVSKIDNQGWPPRPISVSGGLPGSSAGNATPQAASDNPVAQGEALFRTSPPSCFSCHSLTPNVVGAGPSLAGMATLAEQRVKDPSYKGTATDAKSYIQESIVNPSAFLVPGTTFSANNTSFMPNNFAQTLTPEQIDQLVQYLLTLK